MLTSRRVEPEVMDQPGLDPRLHARALTGLSRVNWWSGTSRLLWREMRMLAVRRNLSSLRVLDLACGGGDVALRIARRARRDGVTVVIDGWDKSSTAIQVARDQARQREIHSVSFFEHDVLEDPIPDGYDVVISTLFLHHLSEDDGLRLLTRMHQSAEKLVLLDDLCRSRTGYALAWAGTRLLPRSPIVHVDGPLSVRAAYRPEELLELSRRSGLSGATLHRHWPQRCLLRWERP